MIVNNPPPQGAAKGVNAIARIENWNRFSTANAILTDITGATINITTTKTCTIRASLVGTFFNDNVARNIRIALLIDGTIKAKSDPGVSTVTFPVALTGEKTGLAAGTYTIKAQVCSDGAGNAYSEGPNADANMTNGIFVQAIET